jgi:hypothetical protein
MVGAAQTECYAPKAQLGYAEDVLEHLLCGLYVAIVPIRGSDARGEKADLVTMTWHNFCNLHHFLPFCFSIKAAKSVSLAEALWRYGRKFQGMWYLFFPIYDVKIIHRRINM